MKMLRSRSWMRRPLPYILIIAIATIATFRGAFDCDFVNWDDPVYIYDNPNIRSLDFSHLKTFFTTTEAGQYIPLSRLSVAIDYKLWGNNPFGYHLTAFLLHLVNALLVFYLTVVLIEERKRGYFAGTMAALFFALHPMRVESVVWLSERRDVLAGLFALSSTLCYLKCNEPLRLRTTSRFWHLLCLFFFGCGTLSKISTVMLPAVFLILDFYPLQRFKPTEPGDRIREISRAVIEKIPFLFLSLILGVSTYFYLLRENAAVGTEVVPVSSRLAHSFAAQVWYLEKIIFPHPLNPLVKVYQVYDFHQWSVWKGVLLISGVTLLLLAMRRRMPALFTSWANYLVLLTPFTGFLQSGLQFTADRYTYLASIPISICLGAGTGWFFFNGFRGWAAFQLRIVRGMAFVFVSGVLMAYGMASHSQTKIWKNSETLWTHSLKLDDQNVYAWRGLADVYIQKENFQEALRCALRAVELAPHHRDAWMNVGFSYQKLEKYPESAAAYQRALELSPDSGQVHYSLGWVYAKMGDLSKAIEHYQISQQLKPSSMTLYNLGLCYENRGDAIKAEEFYKNSAEQGFILAWLSLSDLKAKQGKRRDAYELLRAQLPTQRDPRFRLALVESIFNLSDRTGDELKFARNLLQEVDRETQGKSQKVKELMSRSSSL